MPLPACRRQTMHLHHEVAGRGPDLLLLHGWGLHGGVWSPLLPDLVEHFRVHVIDLPGHGRSMGSGGWALPALADRLLDLVPARSLWVGWSLGALVALAAAQRRPDGVGGLILVAATPRFVSDSTWPCAVAPEVLEEFASSLEQNCRSTINRFLSLQLGEGDAERAVLRRLRAEAFRFGEPDRAALREALEVLRGSDFRGELPRIEAPARVVHGECDRLAPPAAGLYLARELRCLGHHRFPRAGHAPFLSDPDAFVQLCREAARG